MKHPKQKLSLLAFSLLGGTAALQGNLLWNGAMDYINPSTNLPFAGAFASGVTSHSGSATYNLSSSLLVNASYSGPAVYGGVYGFSETDAATNGGVVAVARGEGLGNPDLIRFQSPIGGGTVAQTLNGALLFDTAAGSLSEFSSFASNMRMALGSTSGNYAVHWMVVGNGTSYVSQSTTGAMTADFAEFSIDPSSTAWSVATLDSEMALSGLDFSLSSGAITGVTHVGIYLTANTTGHTFDLQTFAAVPEPSTYAALLGALALGFAFWRRRR